jgi:hypothetical protein
MIRSDFIACVIVLGAILAIVGILSTALTMTVTAQNTTDILTTTKNIHNTTFPGDKIVHRGIISSEEATHLVPRPGEVVPCYGLQRFSYRAYFASLSWR